MEILDVLATAIETCLEFLKYRSILTLKDSLLDSLCFRIITLLIESLLVVRVTAAAVRRAVCKQLVYTNRKCK